MSHGVVSKPTDAIICDLCGKEVEKSTYSGGWDHRGQVTRESNNETHAGAGSIYGEVLFGWIARGVSNLTRHARIMWPPPSWERTKSFDERPKQKVYDFHGECILALVEANLFDSTKGARG